MPGPTKSEMDSLIKATDFRHSGGRGKERVEPSERVALTYIGYRVYNS